MKTLKFGFIMILTGFVVPACTPVENPEDDETIQIWAGDVTEPAIFNTDTKIVVLAKPSDLAWLAQETNKGNYGGFSGYTITLEVNIDLGGSVASSVKGETLPLEWTPVGKTGAPFRGSFDGKNKKIYNLLITADNLSYSGLFGFVAEGIIKNLKVESGRITLVESLPGCIYVGVVCGQNTSPGTILNCENKADILVAIDQKNDIELFAGGICGSGNVEDCNNSASINCSVSSNGEKISITNAGGIVGSGYAKNCNNNGVIQAYSAGHSQNESFYYAGFFCLAWAGGICGNGTAEDCVNSANVTATSDFLSSSAAGGIAGRGTVAGCQNLGNVNASSKIGSRAGGICGLTYSLYDHWYGEISDCINYGEVTAWDTEISGYNINGCYAGGISGESALITDCINEGKITASSSGDIAVSGGIGGRQGGTIKQCENKSSVTATAELMGAYAGGICGKTINTMSYNPYYCPVLDCTNNGTVVAVSQEQEANACGISGYAYGLIYDNAYDPTIRRCINNGNASAYSYATTGYFGSSAGGICAGGLVANCTNHANILASSSNVLTTYEENGIEKKIYRSYAGGIRAGSDADDTNTNTGTVTADNVFK